jgi:hypothetical protein
VEWEHEICANETESSADGIQNLCCCSWNNIVFTCPAFTKIRYCLSKDLCLRVQRLQNSAIIYQKIWVHVLLLQNSAIIYQKIWVHVLRLQNCVIIYQKVVRIYILLLQHFAIIHKCIFYIHVCCPCCLGIDNISGTQNSTRCHLCTSWVATIVCPYRCRASNHPTVPHQGHAFTLQGCWPLKLSCCYYAPPAAT